MASTPPDGQPQKLPFVYRRGTIFFLIFVAAGALAIPVIWRSPAFRRPEKIFWIVVAALYTSLAFALLFYVIRIYLDYFRQLQSIYEI